MMMAVAPQSDAPCGALCRNSAEQPIDKFTVLWYNIMEIRSVWTDPFFNHSNGTTGGKQNGKYQSILMPRSQ